ncbi:MAG TPA: hypothetical protein VH599_14695 [Ktedonobacterales bacterium]|jgi:tetratricopeptide (TPR) repeat protein
MIQASRIKRLCESLTIKMADTVPEPVTRAILASLVEAVTEQREEINEKLDRLLGSHYKNGINYLNDAKVVEHAARRQKWIEAALSEFMSASSLEEKPLMTAKSAFFVGVCYFLLGERLLALNWYEKAYQTVCDIENALLKKARQNPLINAGLLLSLYGSPVYGYRKFQQYRTRKHLKEFHERFVVPLSDLLSSLNSQVNTRETARQLETSYSGLLELLPEEE